MRNQVKDGNCGEGRLSPMAPLANPYVPFQTVDAPRYEPRVGLVRGTLFSGLDLPFMGMVNKHEQPVTPMTELQTMAFSIQELALYLDTHREDVEALELYKQMQKLYQKGVAIYEGTYGPLTHNALSTGSYRWLDDPWPWEYAKNREV